jgi:hypothetical protein
LNPSAVGVLLEVIRAERGQPEDVTRVPIIVTVPVSAVAMMRLCTLDTPAGEIVFCHEQITFRGAVSWELV